ncbi:MAG: DUF86 domain-containing protein [Actinomycetota bacterium]|nr:DUF86 domain-containing protein [Actinomycetota bacterium]
MNTPPKNVEGPGEERFVRRRKPETVPDLSSKESRNNEKRERSLTFVLAQMTVLFNDAEKLASLGLEHFESDWVARRAAKNIVAEIGEAVGRLPESYTKKFPGINWGLPVGTRNRIVHDYENVDPVIIWTVLSDDVPAMRATLGL